MKRFVISWFDRLFWIKIDKLCCARLGRTKEIFFSLDHIGFGWIFNFTYVIVLFQNNLRYIWTSFFQHTTDQCVHIRMRIHILPCNLSNLILLLIKTKLSKLKTLGIKILIIFKYFNLNRRLCRLFICRSNLIIVFWNWSLKFFTWQKLRYSCNPIFFF